MKNLIANPVRVRSIIRKFQKSGYRLVSWTEDGPHDSPKLELAKSKGIRILVAVESESIHVTSWGPGADIAYVEFTDVAAFLAK